MRARAVGSGLRPELIGPIRSHAAWIETRMRPVVAGPDGRVRSGRPVVSSGTSAGTFGGAAAGRSSADLVRHGRGRGLRTDVMSCRIGGTGVDESDRTPADDRGRPCGRRSEGIDRCGGP